MKKSVLFRIALVMLVLTMVTSCFVGGTFAKYVTEGSGEDYARVAKFGVDVVSQGYLFAEHYVEVADGNTPGTADLTVSSSNGDKVLAPGTKNADGMALYVTGTPEVSVEVEYDATIELENWFYVDGENKSHFYCPLIFTIDGTTIDGGQYYDRMADFKNAIIAAIDANDGEYGPNINLAEQPSGCLPISWEWPFSTSDANDEKDTYLGDQAAADNAATVKLTVECTVTQID